MKIIKTKSDRARWYEQFRDLIDYYINVNTLSAEAMKIFVFSTIYDDNGNKRFWKHNFKTCCGLIKERNPYISDYIGDLNKFTELVIRMIDKDWLTKDEAIELLQDWPYTDTLVEVIKYDKPLCVNRWEI